MHASAEMSESSLLQLRDLPLGVSARVVRVEGGQGMARKLLGLGLRVGASVEMVHRRGQGVVLANAGNRIALGAMVAEHIWVEPLESLVTTH